MVVHFSSKKQQKTFENEAAIKKNHGQLHKKIQLRLTQLHSSGSLAVFAKPPLLTMTGFHPLKGGRSNEYAIDLSGNYRMVFKSLCPSKNLEEITSIVILGIEDY